MEKTMERNDLAYPSTCQEQRIAKTKAMVSTTLRSLVKFLRIAEPLLSFSLSLAPPFSYK